MRHSTEDEPAAMDLPDGTTLTELTPDTLPPHVDNLPDECGCPVILTGPDMSDTCGQAVGWALVEIQDTYDSGAERMEFVGGWLANEFWVICEDCVDALDDPGEGWSAELPPVPDRGASDG